MAPSKPKSGGKPTAKGSFRRANPGSKPSGPSAAAKAKKEGMPLPKPAQQKSKAVSHGPVKKKKRVYSEKELGIPALNSIKPAGVQKARGQKKGKTFVDDKESMMTILAMVQAEKEGNIESKMMRARQMEEIREARKAEAEKREEIKKQKLEDTKDKFRKTKKKGPAASDPDEAPAATKPKKKRVSFG